MRRPIRLLEHDIVAMDQDVAHRDDLAPRNVRVRFAPIGRQARRGFANQLDTSFQCTTKLAIRSQFFAGAASNKRGDLVCKLHDLT